MVALLLTVLASAWLAAAQDDDAYHPYGAFAFIRTGERTPALTGDTQVLTAVGAQQMYELGQNLRARWIDSDGDAGLGRQNIANMSVDIINNDQISIQTLDTQYLVSSAQAFMQGMYPPHALGNSTSLGDSTGLLADGTTVQAPLDGYQYATVQSFSPFAYNSIYIAGNQNCPSAKLESLQYTVSDDFKNTKAASNETYDKLQTSWFQGNLLEDQRQAEDYDHALEIYDYLSYQYTHNRTIYERLTGNPVYTGVYNATRYYADEYAWNFWGNTASSQNDTDNQAIGGKTLAAEIIHQFQNLVNDRKNHSTSSPGVSHPITLLFGEKDPFISLMSLMLMDARDQSFRAMPPFASAMIFELFSMGQNESFPQSEDDLWVRFYYHNGTTDFNGQLIAFPMFNRGPSQTDMKWSDFQTMFGTIVMSTVVEWCQTCSSPSLFCTGVDSDTIVVSNPKSDGSGKGHAVSPAVAGVIGAIVTLAVAGLLFALAMLAGGIRFHRVQRHPKSELGGFKGSNKLASDPDVASLSKGGAMPAGIVSFGVANTAAGADVKTRHERVGSWELGQKEFGNYKSRDMGDEFPSPRESFEHIDAVASRPVQPRESV